MAAATRQAPPADPARRRSWVTIAWAVFAVVIVAAAFISTLGTETGDRPAAGCRLIAPAAPGGGWDLVARESQQALKADGIVNNVQVVNIPGAAGTIGLGQLADMSGSGRDADGHRHGDGGRDHRQRQRRRPWPTSPRSPGSPRTSRCW